MRKLFYTLHVCLIGKLLKKLLLLNKTVLNAWIERTKRIAIVVLLIALALVLSLVLTILPKTQESSSKIKKFNF